jgi:hypothetical protein
MSVVNPEDSSDDSDSERSAGAVLCPSAPGIDGRAGELETRAAKLIQ